MEGRAQCTSARWDLCPLLHPSGSFSEAQAIRTLLPAELHGATELWRVQPDTLAEQAPTKSSVQDRAHGSDVTLTSCPSLLPHPQACSHTHLRENSSCPSDKAVLPSPSGQAEKRAFLIMSGSSQKLRCSSRSTRLWQNVLCKGLLWNWQFCAEQPGERKAAGSQLLFHAEAPALYLFRRTEVRNVHSVRTQWKFFLLYYLRGFHFINTSKKQILDKVVTEYLHL